MEDLESLQVPQIHIILNRMQNQALG
uniref:Uncharacterized protein n=1 Tax=Anguilla anguilla TaxID=7936 RepID=A0A0E9V028_ANGAN